LKRLVLLILIVAALLAASCTESTTTLTASPTTLGPQPGGNFEITIQGDAFSPPSTNVPAGTTVIWVNRDPFTHTVTADDGVFDSHDIAPDKSYSRLFSVKGVFKYHCSVHSFMKGTITVE